MGYHSYLFYFAKNTDRSKAEIQEVMKVLERALSGAKYLVGDGITLADLSVATNLLLAYEWVMEPAFRSPYPNVNKWFDNVVNQPEVKKALPDFKLCEKMAQFDGKSIVGRTILAANDMRIAGCK